VPDAKFSCLPQTGGNRVVKWRGQPHAKTPPNKRQTKWLALKLRKLHANPANDALALQKDDAAGLHLLLEWPPFMPETAGIRSVLLGIRLQRAIPGRTAVAVQAPRGLSLRIAAGQTGTRIAPRGFRGLGSRGNECL
jgi:hypothetical protein